MRAAVVVFSLIAVGVACDDSRLAELERRVTLLEQANKHHAGSTEARETPGNEAQRRGDAERLAREIYTEIRDRCGREWERNFTMQESCIEQEVAALNSLNAAIANEPGDSSVRAIANRCAEEWGGQTAMIRSWVMARSCFQQELAAYRRLQSK